MIAEECCPSIPAEARHTPAQCLPLREASIEFSTWKGKMQFSAFLYAGRLRRNEA